MSVGTVTMYAVSCDVDGCEVSTDDLGGDYAAWADRDQAICDWCNAGGVVSRDDHHYCPSHAGRVCLECEKEGDPAFIAEHDMCASCHAKAVDQ